MQVLHGRPPRIFRGGRPCKESLFDGGGIGFRVFSRVGTKRAIYARKNAFSTICHKKS